eukprot:gene19196-25045_t
MSDTTTTNELENTTTTYDESSEMEITTNWDEVATTFDAMELKEDLLRGIYAYGFEKPSAIQQTATFAIGILQRLNSSIRECQALILAPTRELAQQIVKVASALGDFMNLKIHGCVGGTAVREDMKILSDGVHIVVDNIQLFVLDEADEMLSRGFKDQIYDVFKFMPER